MKFVRLAAIVVATALVVQAPARASLVLVGGPNQGSFTNNFGFGADGTGSATNPNAKYFTGSTIGSETFGSHLNNAPVAILFVFGANGAVSTYSDSTVGAYDNVEDSQIGVLNLSGATLTDIKLMGSTTTFAFDGDGIGAAFGNGANATGAGAPTNGKDDSNGKYGGPITYFTTGAPGTTGNFTSTNATTVFANFNGGLANNAFTYFSLEGTPTDLSHLGAAPSAPEPASIAMAVTGAMMFFGYGWRRRKIAPASAA